MAVINVMRYLKIVSSLVVVSIAGWLTSQVLVFRHVQIPSDQQLLRVSSVITNIADVLRDGYRQCLETPSKLLCVVAANDQLNVIRKTGSGNGYDRNAKISSKRRRVEHPVSSVLLDFNMAMSYLDVAPVLVEPSILYCMMTEKLKVFLVARRCDMKSILGTSNVVNFAILEQDIAKISSNETVFKEFRFQHYEVKSEAQRSWMTQQQWKNVSSHHFFVRTNIVMHVVVFFHRQSYLWFEKLPALPTRLMNIVKMEKLLYAGLDSAYERFVPVRLEYNGGSIYIPSDPVSFLQHISSSRFLECGRKNTGVGTKKPRVITKKLRDAFLSSTEELKLRFKPMLMDFFLWSETLLGWYRDCGIITTSKIDYATWEIDLEAIDSILADQVNSSWDRLFEWERSDHQLVMRFNNVQTELHFIREEPGSELRHTTRYRDGYYFRYTFPSFDICSAELLGRLVRVPCSVEAVLKAEFGPDLDRPIINYGTLINDTDVMD